MKAFVVFGSQSDNAVFEPLVDNLRSQGIETNFEVISAHRNLEQLQATIHTNKWDIIIAGAGLAAALPGVAAAMTDKPVFGVPVKAHFGGIDALASIAQMPYGVPVASSGAGKENEIVKFLKQFDKLEKMPSIVNIVINPAIIDTPYAVKELTRLKELATEKQVELTVNQETTESFNIILVNQENEIRADELCIHVPLLDAETLNNPASYLTIYDWTNKGGVWICANNARNALLFSLKLFKK